MKQYSHKNMHNQKGDALITVIFFTLISVTISTAAIIIQSLNILSSSNIQVGTEAYSVAESGAENAVLRLLRNPSYTGEVLTIDTGQATITVSGSGPYIINSVGTVGNQSRTVQVQAGYTDNILTVQSWKEL